MKLALVRVSSYQSWYRVPSIGLSYLAAVSEKCGAKIKIFDARYFNMSDRTLIEEIYKFSPDIIGFTAMTHEIKRTTKIAETLKEKLGIPIIIGGCHITALPVRTMEEFPVIDYGVISEGEDTLLDIIKYFTKEKRIEDIGGIVFRDNGKIVKNIPREPIMELDSLPFPAFYHYFQQGRKTLSSRNAYYQMVSSRGCPFNCAFCMRVLGKTLRRRSPENVIEEVNFATTEYGAHTINFADEIFLFNDEKTKEILSKFIERGISKKIKWSGLTRANLVDQEIISLAKRSGCYRLEIGVESGNNDILKRIKKNISVEQIGSAINIIKRARIKVATFYILGHPGENEKTLQETIDLAVKLNTDTIAVGIMVPYPGTKVYEWAQQNYFGYRLRSTDWDDYDKYGRSPLEVEGLSLNKLESFQRKAYIYFYLKNFRFMSLLKFILSRYKGILAVFKKQLIQTG
jgi:radical SAM superfamily enzyme YgiQ (UPF0313 family)